MSTENENVQSVQNEVAAELSAFADELDMEFGDDLAMEIAQIEEEELTQNLEGFASCFPDWDLHPPRR